MLVDIVVVGSLVTDYITRTPSFPRPGETVFGHGLSIGFGGKGANQCLMAAKLGAATAFVGKLGHDAVGDNYLDELKRTTINIDHVTRTSLAQSAVANVVVDDNGENCIVNIPGSNRLMTVEDVNAAAEVIKSAKVLICQNEISFDATKAALTIARQNGVVTVLNAGPAVPNLDPEILNNSDIVCVNETEAEVLTGVPVSGVADAVSAAKVLLTQGCREAVITLGAKGAVSLDLTSLAAGTDHEWVPAEKVVAVDTTGAGDAFIGAMAFYLAKMPTLPTKEKLRRSCAIATQSVLKPGAWLSLPAREELPSHLFDE
ncbi:ribokinase [Hyalella azteca]|uniref:Ribokinase n=1 Tax=Hyalella azteca TaxID=294128 RepID=A0A8B7NJG2_HYAAZ|nr:ribokinase [Hyalella azteca]